MADEDVFARLAQPDGASLVGVKQSFTGTIARTLLQKTGDLLNIQDFGGVSDNTTDSRVALANATASNASVFFPEGTLYASTGAAPSMSWGPGSVRVGSGPAFPTSVFASSKFASRQLSGLEPERLTASTLRVFRGCCSDGTGRVLMEVTSNLTVDVNTVGLNGMDVGVPVEGEDYFLYVLMNSQTKAVGVVVSKEISISLVTKPIGYDLIRKLPWGFIYFAPGLSASGGIRPFSLQGWPKPTTRYTESATIDDWAVLKNGTALTFTAFDLAGYTPDNARIVTLGIVTRHNGTGPAAIASLRVTGAQATGLQVGAVAGPGDRSIVYVEHRVTSARTLLYNVSNGGIVDIYVLGYTNIEPS